MVRPFVFAFSLLVAVAAARPTPAAQMPDPDRVLVIKHLRVLQLLHHSEVLKSYPIALGSHPRGAKRREGDGRTPEGIYHIDGRLTQSAFHLALHLSYPSAVDERWAARRGLDPGDAIYIHGMPEDFGHRDPARFVVDWTNGCIAVGNIAIEEIWRVVPDGTPVEIRP